MLGWLAENALVIALLAGIVAVLCRLGHFRPAVCHALWLVILVKFLTPPVLAPNRPPRFATRIDQAPKVRFRG